LGPIPNPQSPIPNPQSPLFELNNDKPLKKTKKIFKLLKLYEYN
jgi:hypothetical protein